MASYINYIFVLCCFWDIAIYWSKIADFYLLYLYLAPAGDSIRISPRSLSQKTTDLYRVSWDHENNAVGPTIRRYFRDPTFSNFLAEHRLIVSNSPLSGAHVWHMLTRDYTVLPATHMFIHRWNEPYLPLLPSRRASPHFRRYSFSVQVRVKGWVGLSGWSQTEVV